MEHPKGHWCEGHHHLLGPNSMHHMHHHHPIVMPPPIDPLEIDVKNHHELILRLNKYAQALAKRVEVCEAELGAADNDGLSNLKAEVDGLGELLAELTEKVKTNTTGVGLNKASIERILSQLSRIESTANAAQASANSAYSKADEALTKINEHLDGLRDTIQEILEELNLDLSGSDIIDKINSVTDGSKIDADKVNVNFTGKDLMMAINADTTGTKINQNKLNISLAGKDLVGAINADATNTKIGAAHLDLSGVKCNCPEDMPAGTVMLTGNTTNPFGSSYNLIGSMTINGRTVYAYIKGTVPTPTPTPTPPSGTVTALTASVADVVLPASGGAVTTDYPFVFTIKDQNGNDVSANCTIVHTDGQNYPTASNLGSTVKAKTLLGTYNIEVTHNPSSVTTNTTVKIYQQENQIEQTGDWDPWVTATVIPTSPEQDGKIHKDQARLYIWQTAVAQEERHEVYTSGYDNVNTNNYNPDDVVSITFSGIKLEYKDSLTGATVETETINFTDMANESPASLNVGGKLWSVPMPAKMANHSYVKSTVIDGKIIGLAGSVLYGVNEVFTAGDLRQIV